jgi:predicted nuclease with TOPRIM domain
MLIQDKNGSLGRNVEALKLSIAALQAEVEKHKCIAGKSIVQPMKITPVNQEVEHVRDELTKKGAELEKIHKELQSTQNEMAAAKAKVTDSQLQVGALETKVSELQAALTKELAQTQMHNLRTEEYKKKIQDLNRQVCISCFCVHIILSFLIKCL